MKSAKEWIEINGYDKDVCCGHGEYYDLPCRLSLEIVERIQQDAMVEGMKRAADARKPSDPIKRLAKLEAVTIARRCISDALVEQTMGMRDDVNEVVERILGELYEAGSNSSFDKPL